MNSLTATNSKEVIHTMVNTDTWYQLPPNIEAWETVIISNLARKIPEIPSYISSISMPKVDPVMGNADGVINLLNGLASIPITVRGCKLAPIDIMVSGEDEFYPITPTFLQKIYADNVIGTVQNPPMMGDGGEDDGEDGGSAYKVRHFNTVDSVKTASQDIKNELMRKIAHNNELMTFFNTYSPDILQALVTDSEPVKVASAPVKKELPKLHFLNKEANDRYYFNGTPITSEDAGKLLKAANCTAEDGARLLQGGFVCLDYREKTASVCIVNEDFLGQSAAKRTRNLAGHGDSCYLATAMGIDGTAHRGFYIRRGTATKGMPHVFIGPDFYTAQNDILIQDLVEIRPSEIRESAQPEVPLSPRFGIVIPANHDKVIGPGRIISSKKYGNVFNIVFEVDGVPQDLIIAQTDFYTVPEQRLGLLKTPEEFAYSDLGCTSTIRTDSEGKLIIGDSLTDYGNGIYHLMDKFAMSLEDALEVGNAAKRYGSIMFKVAAPDDVKKGKEDSKGSKPAGESPTEDPTAQAQASAQQSQQTQDPAQAQASAEPTAQPSAMNPAMSPDFDSLQDIAKVNDPQLMDTYLSANLTDVNVAGREEIMQISDDVVEAVKSLGKLLFRIRLGQIDYVKEGDVQTAFNKMSEVANALGLSSTQINTSLLNNYQGPMPTGSTTNLQEQSAYAYR